MNIVDLTEAQRLLFEQLISVFDEEREILVHDKCQELKGIIDKKEYISHKLSIIEAERQRLYPGKKAESFVAEGVLDEETLMQLKKLIQIAKEKSDVNMALTRQSLNYIRTITAALDTRNKTLTYGNTGKLEDDSSASLFSQKI